MGENRMHVLDEVRKRNSDVVAGRVEAAICALLEQGRVLSFYSVASTAEVARSTLYRRADLKALVVRAREAARASGESVTSPLAAYAARLSAENRRLRAELELVGCMSARTLDALERADIGFERSCSGSERADARRHSDKEPRVDYAVVFCCRHAAA